MMTKCKMKKLVLAVGVALGGMGVIGPAQAVHVSQDRLGQALIFPYYSVRGGWITTISLTNTSSSDFVAVKVRFNEAYNSRDALDLNVVLSPNDIWNAWVADTANGPAIYTVDKSCTTPQIPPGGGLFPGQPAYTTTLADGGPTTVDRMREGYVEAIMMGTANKTRLQAQLGSPLQGISQTILGAEHDPVTGTPPGCAALAAAFSNDPAAFVTPFGLAGQFGYPDASFWPGLPDTRVNPLKGAYTLVNSALGWSAGGTPVALANFWGPPGQVGANLMSMLLAPGAVPVYRLSSQEPSLNASNTAPHVYNSVNSADVTAPVNASGAENVGFVINSSLVINDWSRRTDPVGWTTDTDWVLTYPTKKFYVDNQWGNAFAGRAAGRNIAPQQLPTIPGAAAGINATGTGAPTPFASYFTNQGAITPRLGNACDASVIYSIFNREEKTSPANFSPNVTAPFCFETNVLTFDSSNILRSENNPFPLRQFSSINGLPGEAGWLQLGFTPAGGLTAGNIVVPTGRPVVGFQITVRNTANTQLNEAMIFEHSYSRTYP
jgi:hypothetical protein